MLDDEKSSCVLNILIKNDSLAKSHLNFYYRI